MTQETVSQIVSNVLSTQLLLTNDIDVKRTIKSMIKRSNPYSIHLYDNDISFLLDKLHTYLNKSWETRFGNILESIQIELSGGVKSSEVGMDIDLPKNKYVGSKSGPNWANSDQRQSIMRNAKRIVESKNAEVFVVCTYGKGRKNYNYYTQVAGQEGWEVLTNDSEMYQKINVALEENKTTLQEIKNKVVGDIKKQSLDFWKETFYTNNKFESKKYLDYVSKK
jgi:hypothetical protein